MYKYFAFEVQSKHGTSISLQKIRIATGFQTNQASLQIIHINVAPRNAHDAQR